MPTFLEEGRLGPLAYALREPDARAGRHPPVLCFLHGYDEGRPTPLVDGVTRHGPLRADASALGEAFVVVAPQLPACGDLWHVFGDDVLNIVMAACEWFDADPHRIFLTGFSFGGNGVFDLGLAHDGFWSALWAVDPTRVPDRALEQPVWLTVGEVARRRAVPMIAALQARPFAADPSQRRLYLDEGESHVGSATRAYRDDRIYEWLLARGRAAGVPRAVHREGRVPPPRR